MPKRASKSAKSVVAPRSIAELISDAARGNAAAIKSFRKIGPSAVPELIAAWSGPIPTETHPRDFLENITAAISEASRKNAGMLIQAIREELLIVDPLLWLAVGALGDSHDPRVNDELLSLLNHKTVLIRETAARALIERKVTRAVEPLLALLAKSRADSMLQFTLVQGMRQTPEFQDVRAIPSVEKIVAHPRTSPGTRNNAVALLDILRVKGTPLRSVQRLDWTGQKITPEMLDYGGKCTRLKSLIDEDVKGFKADVLQQICRWKTLEELTLEWDWGWPRLDADQFGLFKKLKRLHLRNCKLADKSAGFLRKLPSLEDLSLIGMNPPDAALANVGKMPRLLKLRWDYVHKENSLEWLASLKTLQSLRFHSLEPITTHGATQLGKLLRLEFLSIDNSDLDDTGLAALGSLRRLRFLALPRAKITLQGLKTLARFPSLTHLDFDDIPLGDAGLRALASFPSLKALSLRRWGLSEKSVGVLIKMTRLKQLIIYGELSGHVRTIQEAIPHIRINSGYSLSYP